MSHYFSEQNDSSANIFKIKINLPINNGVMKKTEVFSANSIFSSNEIDLGTRVLLKYLDKAPDNGLFLDVGCGWGPISIFMSLLRPNAKIIAIDVNSISLKVLKMNYKLLKLNNIQVMTPPMLERKIGNKKFDFIMSNPPIRVGQKNTVEIIEKWYSYLKSDGKYFNVIQRNLGADSILTKLNALDIISKKVASKKGFRIIESTKH